MWGLMKMRTSKIVILLAAAAVLILPSLSRAEVSLGTVTVAGSGPGAGDFLSVFGGGHVGTDLFTGVYMLDKSVGTGMGMSWPNGPLPAFCVELQEPAPHWTATYDVIKPNEAYDSVLAETLGTTKAGYLSELWGRYNDPSWAGSGPFTSTQNNESAAFAAAVWEIVYEDLPDAPLQWNVNVDSSAGPAGFRINGADSVLANTWLHSLNGTGQKATLAVLTSQANQNYIVAVPEPATLVLLGLGGAFSLARRGRRIRRTATDGEV